MSDSGGGRKRKRPRVLSRGERAGAQLRKLIGLTAEAVREGGADVRSVVREVEQALQGAVGPWLVADVVRRGNTEPNETRGHAASNTRVCGPTSWGAARCEARKQGWSRAAGLDARPACTQRCTTASTLWVSWQGGVQCQVRAGR